MSDEPELPVPHLQEIEPLDGEEMKAAIAREIYVASKSLARRRHCWP